MKKIKLSLKLLFESRKSFAVLIVLLLISQISFIYIFSLLYKPLKYNRVCNELHEQGRFAYFDMFGFGSTESDAKREAFEKMVSDVGADSVLYTRRVSSCTINGFSLNLYSVTDERAFERKFTEMLHETASEGYISEDGAVEAVYCGKQKDIRKGNTYQVKIRNGGDKAYPIKIIGIISPDSLVTMFSEGGSSVSAYSLFDNVEESLYIIRTTETDEKYPAFKGMELTPQNGLIFFNDGYDEETVQNSVNMIKDLFIDIQTDVQIVEKTKETTSEIVKSSLALPFFLFSIAFLSTVAVSFMIVDEKMKTLSIYYLSGCKKKTGHLIVFGSFLIADVIALVTGLLMIFLIDKTEAGISAGLSLSVSNVIFTCVHFLIFAILEYAEVIILVGKKSFIDIKNVEVR